MKKIYFKSLCLEDEITPLQLNTEGGVIAFQNVLGEIEKCELHTEKELSHVVYFSSWPSKELIKKHITSYPNCRFEIKSKLKGPDGKRFYKRYVCTPEGNLEFVIEEFMNSKGDIVRENRLDSELKFVGAIEYEYDKDGEIILTREIAENGDIISEDESI